MNKPVTIHDMAKMLKVSPATVSRVVSNSSYPVSQKLKKKINDLAKELGYTPNMLGRQLKTKNSMTIGVVIPSISNPFYADVVLGIEEIARRHGYQVLLCNSHQDPKLEAEYLQTLLEKQVKGLIISFISDQKELLSEYLSRGLKIISIDQMVNHSDVYQIGFNYRQGGYLATKYLIEKNHKKIAFLSAPLDRPSRLGIFRGYQDALQESGITPLDSWVQLCDSIGDEIPESTYEFKNGKQLVRNMLKLDDQPTAIITCNDLTAIGIINELNQQGIEVPGQISVIGFDNIELSQMITPPLTSVDHPKYEMGRFACSMLMDILNGNQVNVKEIVLQPKMIIRNSVGSVS